MRTFAPEEAIPRDRKDKLEVDRQYRMVNRNCGMIERVERVERVDGLASSCQWIERCCPGSSACAFEERFCGRG